MDESEEHQSQPDDKSEKENPNPVGKRPSHNDEESTDSNAISTSPSNVKKASTSGVPATGEVIVRLKLWYFCLLNILSVSSRLQHPH